MPALKQKAKSDGGVQAVALALQIIEALAFRGPQSVTELAKQLGTTKTRIFNYLRTLVEHGYATQDPETERYGVGYRAAQIGGAVANEFDLVSVSRAPMTRIHQEFGHTVVLSKFDNSAIYCAAQIEGTGTLKISIPMGYVLGFHATAQGKVALAFGPPSLLETVIEKGLKPVTKATIIAPDRLRKEVATVRKRGWATAPNQAMARLDTLSVPIINKSRRFVGALAIIMFAEDMAKQPMEHELAALQQAAAEISAALALS